MPTIQKRTDGLRFLEERAREAFRAIEMQKEVLDRAEREVDARRNGLVEADRELKVVEKHHENWLADWKREHARQEQRQSEEITLARYAREDRGSE
jgi:flagellar export protein FliJ